MSESIDEQIIALLPGGRRHGKSLAQAKLVAQMLKEGHTVSIGTSDGKMHNVVGVPGFDDGRQLEGNRNA